MLALRSMSLKRVVTRAINPSVTNTALRALSGSKPKIIYTLTDEAPMLATFSLYPILKTFAGKYSTNSELYR